MECSALAHPILETISNGKEDERQYMSFMCTHGPSFRIPSDFRLFKVRVRSARS